MLENSPGPSDPSDGDVCETAARFLAGLGEAAVTRVHATHVANRYGDCGGCGGQLATHWPCLHVVLARRAGELLAQRRRW